MTPNRDLDNYTHEDADEFSRHPIKAYDPFYTRDFAMFDYHYDLFKRYLVRELRIIISDIETEKVDPNSLETRKRISYLHSMRESVERKCKAYAYHTGINLISRCYSL